MTHQCDFSLDLDNQVTCSICGAMDDEMETPLINWKDPYEGLSSQLNFE